MTAAPRDSPPSLAVATCFRHRHGPLWGAMNPRADQGGLRHPVIRRVRPGRRPIGLGRRPDQPPLRPTTVLQDREELAGLLAILAHHPDPFAVRGVS
jgi:hypothetical protein